MKHLKTKLMTSVVMLLIATVLMSTASYAWFTISTNPEIANIQANVTANGNLEIALDAGNNAEPADSTTTDAGKNETWGNLVDLKGFFEAGDTETITLKPVQFLSTAEGDVTIKKPVYGKDGRISSLTALTRENAADAASGNFKDFGGIWVYTDDTTATTGAAATSDAHIYAFEVDFWLRTNVAESTVSLTQAVSRTEDTSDDIAGETGLGSYITDEKNATILFTDGTSWYMAKRGTAVNGKYPLTLVSATINATTGDITPGEAATIALTKDTAKKIKMFVFMDGTAVKNANALLNITKITMNIQFTSSATLASEDVEMSDYGRN